MGDKDFNRAISQAMIKIAPTTRHASSAKAVKYEFINTRVLDDDWPQTFQFDPKVGDLVESSGGRRLEIKAVIHRPGRRVCLMVGKDSGGVTPVSGGGALESA